MVSAIEKGTLQDVESKIAHIIKSIEEGYSKDRIAQALKIGADGADDLAELFEIAKARIRNRKLRKTDKAFFFTQSDISFATPEIAADYRAEKLFKRSKTKVIADLGSGIGLQSIAFSKRFKRVYAVEMDARKHLYSKKNAEIAGAKNIIFVNYDMLDKKAIAQLKDADTIFCDTERALTEEERKVETIKPDIKDILRSYSKLTDCIAIEIPPQISLEKVSPFDCEKEFISIDNELNRLTLYFGKLKEHDRSIVLLPGKESLSYDADKKEKAGKSIKGDNRKVPVDSGDIGDIKKLSEYMYEINPSVIKAGLQEKLAHQMKADAYYEDRKSCFLSSPKRIKSPFFKNSFNVLASCPNEFNDIVENLQKFGAGSIILRARIDPDRYWEERKRYEKELKGDKTLYLFFFGEVVICERID